MDFELFSAFALFAFVSSITPGPNNMMLMASGANHGFRQTIPHMLGIGVGFVIMVVLVGVGLVRVFDLYPVSYDILRWVSIGYLFLLAWKIATAPAPGNTDKAARPMTFLEAALFQWVNPKGWAMALTAIAVYAPSQSIGSVVLTAVLFGVINLPSVGCWTVLGERLQPLLMVGRRMQVFNLVMAGLLLTSLFQGQYA